MDYVKFEKAKELRETIEHLKMNRERLAFLFAHPDLESLNKYLNKNDYEKVMGFAINLVVKHIEEAEDEFRLL